jgi:hypothetical protein
MFVLDDLRISGIMINSASDFGHFDDPVELPFMFVLYESPLHVLMFICNHF